MLNDSFVTLDGRRVRGKVCVRRCDESSGMCASSGALGLVCCAVVCMGRQFEVCMVKQCDRV